MHLEPGSRVGRYEVVGPLGAGGMGEVVLARDPGLEREVALKALPARLPRDPDAIARLRREALTLASLNHPNIASIYGFEEAPDGAMVLVLERVEGETLAERLRRGALPVLEALQMCGQIALALEVAHERGVVHRDIKPGNVMIGPRGLVKVLDFGLARRRGDPRRPAAGPAAPPAPTHHAGASRDAETAATIAMAPAGGRERIPAVEPATPATERRPPTQAPETRTVSDDVITGTPGYMSPEQVLAGDVDERSDVFAFGCVLYECLTGRKAFTGSDLPALMRAPLEQAADLALVPPAVPATVRALIGQCLERDATRRPAGIRQVRVGLEEALGVRRASALREGHAYATPHNLPPRATRFVGRRAVLEACGRLLDGARELTLTGLGGSGKTRVAIQLAESLLDRYRDGVWFVDLAPITEPGRVAEVAAGVLGVVDEPGRLPIESLTRHVGDRHMLFVVDNCEEVPDGARDLVAALLRACPSVRVLATSREALGLDGEAIFRVPSLSVPGAARPSDAAALLESEGVELFVDRAAAALPGFTLTPENAAAIAEICRRLDGIPLALELAAARVHMLGVEQVRARLGDRFKLLARPGASAPSRRDTVLAVLQWSWDHLLPAEQQLMRRLAVFTGGWTLERATVVCSDPRDEFEVLDLLTRLAARSLVVVEHHGGAAPRFRFLESVWRFASDQLEAHADGPTMRERHLALYLELAEDSERVLNGPGLAGRLAELEPEEENLLAALHFSAHADDGARRGLRLVASISRFWSVLGRYELGRRALKEALSRPGADAPGPERAQALLRLAGFDLSIGDYLASRHELEESLAIRRAGGHRRGIAAALGGLGVVAMFELRLEDARALGEESLALYEELGQTRGVAMALHNLGSVEWALGTPDYGRTRFERALALLRDVGDVSTEALCLSALASSLVHLGELAPARERLHECLAALTRVEAKREAVFALEAVVELLLALGRPREAARLMGAAEAARRALRLPLMPIEKAGMERLEGRAREALGPEELTRQRSAGSALTLPRALAEAAARVEG